MWQVHLAETSSTERIALAVKVTSALLVAAGTISGHHPGAFAFNTNLAVASNPETPILFVSVRDGALLHRYWQFPFFQARGANNSRSARTSVL